MIAEEVAESSDGVAEEDQVAGGEAGRFEFGVEGIGVGGPVFGGRALRPGGVEGDVGIGLEGFGDGQDGDALVIEFEFSEVVRVGCAEGGKGEAGLVAKGAACRVAGDAVRGRGRDQAALAEATMKPKGERADRERPVVAVRPRERDRLGERVVRCAVAELHGGEVGGP